MRSVVVIGGGPGGYPAAFHAADLGMQVTLIDTEPNPGGVCLYRGCIPSKALLHAAQILNEARAAAEWGITFSDVAVDVDKLRARKESVVSRLTGGLGQLTRQRKITYLHGRAAFVDAHNLAVHLAAGGTQAVSFDDAIVASGSRPVALPFAPDSSRVMDSTGALALADVPETLLLIGGGYIGLELGQLYAALGSKVSVVEMMPGLLPGADRDLVQILAARLKKQFADIMLDTKVEAITEEPNGIRVRFSPPSPPGGEGRGEGESPAAEQLYSKVLIAVGRKPVTDTLDIANTRAVVGPGGFIEVDARRRTAEPNILAVGDVAGQPMLAHKATYEGKVAAEVIAGMQTQYDPGAIPAVVFTDPEIAWCGLTEGEASAQGREVRIAKFPWAASGRATTLGRNDGLTKLVLDPATDRVLGVGLAGPNAGELIAEGTLAVEMGAVAEDLALTIHAHPTLSEIVKEAAEASLGHAIHFMGR